jgi:REP-associated tyrosine transposase
VHSPIEVMARPLRLELPGGIHHVTARGDRRQPIFEGVRDRLVFLEVFDETLRRFRWDCLSYCLMGNHYHLLVLTPQPNLSLGMRFLNGTYARRFNDRRAASGHVFQGRFDSVLVQREEHVLATLRYIALNPVVAGLCGSVNEWYWSGHRALAGLTAPARVSVSKAYEHLPGPARGPRQYRALVDGDQPTVDVAASGVIRGDPDFVAEHAPAFRPSLEIPRREWQPQRPSLAELLGDQRDAQAIARAHHEFGYTQSAIARELGCSYSTVSRRLRGWRMTERKT